MACAEKGILIGNVIFVDLSSFIWNQNKKSKALKFGKMLKASLKFSIMEPNV